MERACICRRLGKSDSNVAGVFGENRGKKGRRKEEILRVWQGEVWSALLQNCSAGEPEFHLVQSKLA